MKKVKLIEVFNTSLGKKIVATTNETINVGDTVVTDKGDIYIVKGLSLTHNPQDERIIISV